MTAITARMLQPADIETLLDLWHTQRDIELQLDPRLAVLPMYTQQNAAQMRELLVQAGAYTEGAGRVGWVAQGRAGQILGFVLLHLWQTKAQFYGEISAFVVDAHYGQGGVGSVLLDAARQHADAYGVARLSVVVPRFAAVQQAFWRAKNATALQETFVIRVKSPKDDVG